MSKSLLASLAVATSIFAFCDSSAMAATVALDDAAGEEIVDSDAETTDNSDSNAEIVVLATRIRGSVETEAAPIAELNEADVQALGASSISDIVASLAPQSGSGRGRGSGPPVILLNGQRVSSFREIRDLPSDAIKKVEVFPEEVALQYGFRPDQRVMNFILKDNFASFSTEVEVATPGSGGYGRQEFETTFTRIGKDSRLNIDMKLERRSKLTEDERGVAQSATSAPYAIGGNITGIGIDGEIDPALSALVGSVVTTAAVPAGSTPSLAAFAANAGQIADGVIGQYRTLLPSFEHFETALSWSKTLSPATSISVNGAYETQDDQGLNGLPYASIAVPGSSAYSPFTSVVQLNRYFQSPGALTRNQSSDKLQFGAGLNSMIADWRLNVTADYQLDDVETRSTTNADYAALRAAVTAGTINPFVSDFGSDLLFLPPDTSDSTSGTLSLKGTMSGKPLLLPAGPVLVTLRSGYDRQTIDSSANRRGIVSDISLRRDNANAALNVEVPLVERGVGGLGVIGDVSINGNFGVSDLSDFGLLKEYGAGFRWAPAQNLSFSASVIGDENAPSLAQLGNPSVLTSNVAYYDFQRGESRFIDILSGGNAALISESRRDLKLGVDWSPKILEGLGIQVEYFRNKSSNTTATFPLLTPEIEAAFADRVTRDANGQLVRLDQRPVNFDSEKSQRIRWGFNASGGIGPQPQGRGMGGAPGGGSPAGMRPSGGVGPRMGGGRGMMVGMPGAPQGGRWQFALYHTYRIEDKVLIRAGVPELDLLNGSATGALGGSPRHELSLSGGVFMKGIGLRLEGSYRSGTRVDGNSLTGTSDLRFSDLKTLNAFVFFNLDQQAGLIKAVPMLKGSRIMIRVDNVFDDIMDVRDNTGAVPLSYQPGLLDPSGRVFEISLRKRF